MEAIGPIGGAANRPTPAPLVAGRPASGGAASAGAAMTDSSAAVFAQSMTFQSSSVSMSAVSSRVDTFLAQLGGDLGDNQLLRMIIGLLILELLLGKGGEAGRGGDESLGALAQLSNSSQSSRMLAVQTSTSVIQFDYASTALIVGSGMQSSAETQPDVHPGEQIDLSI